MRATLRRLPTTPPLSITDRNAIRCPVPCQHKGTPMSLIERSGHYHLNVKKKDEWVIVRDDSGNPNIPVDSASIYLALNDQHGKRYGGLSLNHVSPESLERLKSVIVAYLTAIQ